MTTSQGTVTFSNINGYNSLYFPSAAVMGSASTYGFTSNVTSLFIVAQETAQSGQGLNMLFSLSSGAGNGDLSVRIDASYYLPSPGNGNDVGNNGTASSTYMINGTAITTTNLSLNTAPRLIYTPINATVTSAFTISSTFISRYFIGYVYEVLMYSGIPTVAQRQQVEGYLAWKWGLQTGLPSGHPNTIYRPLFYNLPTNLLTYTKAFSLRIAPVFLPTQLSGCALWLDAADMTSLTFSSGNNISTWNDKSGNGLSGQGVAGPVYQTNSLNGLPGINFNGNSQYFNFGNVLNLGTNPIYIFAVCKFSSTADGGIVGKTSYRGYVSRWGVLRLATDGGMLMYIDAGTGTGNTVYATTSTSPQLIEGYWDRSTVYNLLNGTQQVSSSAANTSNLIGTDRLLVGAYGDSTGTSTQAGFFFPGNIYEILVYNSTLTSVQRQQVESYLSQKWGLVSSMPSDHKVNEIVAKFSQASLFSKSVAKITASGAYTIQNYNGKDYYIFTATGTVSISISSAVSIFMVGGGGGGCYGYGGGGGAGGLIANTSYSLTGSTVYTISIGSGGGTNGGGGDTTFDILRAYGGGSGGGYQTQNYGYGGGCGGGGGYYNGSGGAGTAQQGYAGGNGNGDGGQAGGGGGGIGGPGQNANNGTATSGYGGLGVSYIGNLYGGGGAGGGFVNTAVAVAGGGQPNSPATNGTGGGGGGSVYNQAGSANVGGTGVFIISLA